MEAPVVTDLNPVYGQLYLDALRQEGLHVYTKDLNLDGWIRSIDIYLVYDDPEELRRAREIVKDINL